MAAQIPIKDDPKANAIAMTNVRADKLREVRAGHDGTWVAHPALAAIAADVFNTHMPTPNQLYVRRADVEIAAKDLLNMDVPGRITEDGIRKNLSIGLGYMEGWLRGVGCVPINYLMVRLGVPPARQTSRMVALSLALTTVARTGGRRDGRSQSQPTVAMVPSRRVHGRRYPGRQGLRAAAAARAGRRAGLQGTKGQ